MKKLVALVLILFVFVSMSFALKVGITFMTTNNPFFIAMLDAVKADVEGELGGTVLVSDGQFDVAKTDR